MLSQVISALVNFPEVQDAEEKLAYIEQHGKKSKKYGTSDIEVLSHWVLIVAKKNVDVSAYLTSKQIGDEEALYRYLTKQSPICRNGKIAKYRGLTRGYQGCGRIDTCRCVVENMLSTNKERYGDEHPAYSTNARKKRKQTNIRKYGVENVAQVAEHLEKAATANVIRYGVSHPSQNPMIVDKAKETNHRLYGGHPMNNVAVQEKRKKSSLARHGTEHPQTLEEVKEKIKNTNLEKYGVVTPLQLDYVVEKNRQRDKSNDLAKRKQTNLAKYGCEHAVSAPEVQARIVETNLVAYGVSHPLKSEIVRARIQETNLQRYGGFHQQKHISEEARAVLNDKDELQSLVSSKSVITIAEQLGIHYTTVSNYCKSHDINIPKSGYESEIAHFLRDLGMKFETNTRKIIRPLELDFHIADRNIAIEFNGLFWHSSHYKKDNYHREKYERCHDLGIRLLMFNEDEWGDAAKLKIRNVLGLSETGVGARKLKINKISNGNANDFFARFHLQGSTGSLISAFGAFHNEELVGCVAYNRQRGTDSIELIRYCTDGKVYPGLFSKLFKHSCDQEDYQQIVSFADLRYSTGDVYLLNGFTLVGEIRPDYRYVFEGKARHKSGFTKKNIAKKFGVAINGSTERQLMEELNIPRIYDCGKLKFVWCRA